jgi:SAM-dependent methyltransferase
MKFPNMKLLNDVILDYSNPDKIYKLAREYDRLQQGSAAFGFYLRAADMSPGKTIKDQWLQYKCMILSSFIYERNGNRGQSVEGLLKIAVDTLPDRPEAYYFLAKYKQDKDDWRECLMYAKIGLSCNTSLDNSWVTDNDVGYPGDDALRLIYARAKWKTNGRDDSKNLAFDLKYKRKVSPEVDRGATALLAEHGYPSTLAYVRNEFDRFKYAFTGLEDIEKNYSRHFQDMFVLSVLDGKRDGTFVELGCGHPELYNNTLLLEEEFGWRGISLDNSERMCHIFSRQRNTNIICADAATVDYKVMFKQNCLEQHIDFLRINAERASVEALSRIPFDKYEFSVIQFQHNAVWWGPEFREESRKILTKIGYVLLVSDVSTDEKSNYEDWWVHPMHAKRKIVMKSVGKHNFAWDYIMEKQK